MCVQSSLLRAPLLTFLDYTSPVFLWTNIEISLGVFSACLPTYRPIWLYFRGTSDTAGKSYRMRSYSRFGTFSSRGSRWPGQGSLAEEDRRLNPGPYVNTVIESGAPSSKDAIDGNAITVEQDMFTDTKSGPLQRSL